tara:strand:- start:383 stop:1312 length:930 start_codon:yes stop_codon:yes gene_type:complete
MIKKKIFLLLTIFFLNFTNVLSLENKILIKVDNEIITTVDVLNESKYIKAMNKGLENISDEDLWKISINSIKNEKIRMVEILNHVDEIKISDENLKIVMQSVYKRLGFEELEEFKNFLEINEIDYEFLKRKVEIETVWNELIYSKYYDKILINREELLKKIKSENQKVTKSFLLSEIVFDINKDTSVEKKFLIIENEIKKSGFKNAAFSFSISNSSKSGGNIGWVNENTINQKLKTEISKLEIGQYTKPIIIPGGALILKLENIKEVKNNKDIDKKLNEMVKYLTNEQLNQFSNIYFNKIKKNIQINES